MLPHGSHRWRFKLVPLLLWKRTSVTSVTVKPFVLAPAVPQPGHAPQPRPSAFACAALRFHTLFADIFARASSRPSSTFSDGFASDAFRFAAARRVAVAG